MKACAETVGMSEAVVGLTTAVLQVMDQPNPEHSPEPEPEPSALVLALALRSLTHSLARPP